MASCSKGPETRAKKSKTKHSENMSYENCIITEHSESSESLLSNTEETEDQSALNFKDTFILMVGLLLKIEKHMCKKEELDYEVKSLISEIQCVTKILIEKCQEFGFNQDEVRSMTLLLPKSTVEEASATQSRHSENHVDKNELDNGREKLNRGKAITRPKATAKKKTSKKIEKMTSTPKLKSNMQRRGEKRHLSSQKNGDRRSSQILKKKCRRELRDLNQIREEATVISKEKGEDFELVYYRLQKEAGFNPMLPRKLRVSNRYSLANVRPEKEIEKLKNLSLDLELHRKKQKQPLTPKSKSLHAVKTPEKIGTSKKKSSLQNSATKSRDQQNASRGEGSVTRSAKRKLYSPGLWLESLSGCNFN